MNEIKVLDRETIDKIAAGEVVERPGSVVKELLENSIDSGATSVSVEIKNGGIDLIRVTDNGSGIPEDQLRNAVKRHCTSKIENISDLLKITTLGFRGEALSSICAVSRLEIMTKTSSALMGAIYRADGQREISLENAGLPDGTTVVVRNLFFNVPARLKFLKSPKAEAGFISDTVQKIALSHPDISFKFINNGAVKLLTPGRGDLKETIYSVFGREISENLLEVNSSSDCLKISGYIGKPEISRSGRMLENYFINGRYVKDKIIAKAVEDSYRGYQMKGTYPFCCINIIMDPDLIDVNVHPAKMEVKFFDSGRVYSAINNILAPVISERENIPEFTVLFKEDNSAGEKRKTDENTSSAPFYEPQFPDLKTDDNFKKADHPSGSTSEYTEKLPKTAPEPFETKRIKEAFAFNENISSYSAFGSDKNYSQSTLYDNKFISDEAAAKTRIIGQVFGTYWIAEYEDRMYIIDQHAAHEKVLYEKFMKELKNGRAESQMIYPAIIVSLSSGQEIIFNKYAQTFKEAGFEAECFGGSEYLISAVPASLYSSIDPKNLFLDILEELSQPGGFQQGTLLPERVASAACKAAVKGNRTMSAKEAAELINSLLGLENPYNCPHGRPTMISMSRYELEKKFKRII